MLAVKHEERMKELESGPVIVRVAIRPIPPSRALVTDLSPPGITTVDVIVGASEPRSSIRRDPKMRAAPSGYEPGPNRQPDVDLPPLWPRGGA